MTREQMHAELLAVINRKPYIGVSCVSVDVYNAFSTEGNILELQNYANALLRENICVDKEIARLRKEKGDA